MAAWSPVTRYPFFFLFSSICAGGLSCGNRIPPPGGPVDEIPPRIVSIYPDSNDVNVALDAVVRVGFDEEIVVTRGREAVSLVPLHSRLDTRLGWDYVELRPAKGLRPGCTYAVGVTSEILDLRGNRLSDPLLYFFTTGNTMDSGIIRGHVERDEDLKGDAFLQAVYMPDSLVYMTGIDAEGSFLMTHLPPGSYDMVAFIDARHDRHYDPGEDVADVRKAILDDGELEIDFHLAQ